jgi:WD40 repeat protein
MSPPPTPFHLLRTHHSPLSSLAFNPSNTCLYAGDQDGFVSVTDLRARRVIAYWKAHENGVLGVGEWDRRLIRCALDSSCREGLVH